MNEKTASSALFDKFNQFHLAVSSMLRKNEQTETGLSNYDIVEMISESDYLWVKCCKCLATKNIITSLATKEYLKIFLEEN